ncbi:Protein BCP1 [Zalerion maritima]|uniref:Protein BCP1 n=1 Tax=Zalerion maritima TaxID=339359 RepID=A0AAD5S3W4_9PEZI|nr:Protein BCP1 [Zalerion maritima]
MGKKRSRDPDVGVETSQDSDKMEVDEGGSDYEDFDAVNVDFEWFNFDADIDFKGVRSLLRQLLDVDNELIDVSTLSDVIVAQNTIGSTVKVDSKENDPYCFLTALNLKMHRENAGVASFVKYLTDRAKSSEALKSIPDALENKHVGVLLSERFINMPAQIAPPLYSMLLEELEDAVEDKEPYDFSHFLVVSKTYHEVDSVLGQEQQRKKKPRGESPLFYFHPEDEVMQRYATVSGSYLFTGEAKSAADSKRVFQEAGIKTMGFMMLVEASKFREAIKAVGEYVGSTEG